MDKCKIIQIIPAPADLLLRYRNGYIDFAEDASNFYGIDWKEAPQ